MSNGLVHLSNVRLSFPVLVEAKAPRSTPDGKKTFNAVFLMPSDHPGVKDFLSTVQEVALTQWKDKATDVMAFIKSQKKLRSFSSGEEHVNQETFAVYDGYAGQFVISAKSDAQPQIIRADGRRAEPTQCRELAEKMYGGCYVNAVVRPWAQDNVHGKGLRCELVAVQFARDGDSFGAGPTDVSSMFAPVTSAAAAMPKPPFSL